MSFYQLPKEERAKLVANMQLTIINEIKSGSPTKTMAYFSDEDTYIRKAAYLTIGKIYFANKELQTSILHLLENAVLSTDSKVRQTTINAAGEIGMRSFDPVSHFFDRALFDPHHTLRNAVIGSVKKMGEKNPKPVSDWAKKYLHHEDKEIRREICHGIELRGRTHPQDILPLLAELQFDKTTRVKNTLVHVIGQISYKKGCLATVVKELNTWSNKELVKKAVEEIIDVHDRYKDFSILSHAQAIQYIEENLNV